jgi:nicotinamidase-related amidase
MDQRYPPLRKPSVKLVTARYAMELGYHVTPVRDATATFTHEMMHAAHELNGPAYAHSILTTTEVIAVLPMASHSEEIVK